MLSNAIALSALAASAAGQNLLTDIRQISQNWGQLSPYSDNPEDYFGVKITGLPDGCQVEQAHSLQRHAQRFPTGAGVEGTVATDFAGSLANFTKANPKDKFKGPLSFLNSYKYELGSSLLTGVGATTEFQAGVTFWNRYGRVLYNATQGQLAYNSSHTNGTARRKPVLRTTSQSRIWNSQINWALGFFGDSFQTVPNPTLANFTAPYDVVIITEGGTENNTLASYDSCLNDNDYDIGYIGDQDLFNFIGRYLGPAQQRLQAYAPNGFTITTNDTYAMQYICAAETGYLGASSFCNLFTAAEWAGFNKALSILYYYDYAWGNPTGRAQGIGYVEELLARITKQYIKASDSSVNSTIDNNPTDFPLGEPFYSDFTHDDIIISALTAMSVEYFHDPPSLTVVEKPSTFNLSHLTPFGGRLVTEIIGCNSPTPVSLPSSNPSRQQYYATQYGYNAKNATHKFIRMRLNHGIIPLSTIRGGKCANGRPDELCELDRFIESQSGSYALSNYNYACFGNYTLTDPTNGADYDGTIGARTNGSAY